MKKIYILILTVLATFSAYVLVHSFKYVPKPTLSLIAAPIVTPATFIVPSPIPTPDSSTQVIRGKYGPPDGFLPYEFTVKSGLSVRLEVDATEDGIGCMGSLMVPDFSSDIVFFEKNKTAVITFTPTSPGLYFITCAMGIPHASLIVK